MDKNTITIIIYAIGIVVGALFLDIWGAETSVAKAMVGIGWTILFLVCLFYFENNKEN